MSELQETQKKRYLTISWKDGEVTNEIKLLIEGTESENLPSGGTIIGHCPIKREVVEKNNPLKKFIKLVSTRNEDDLILKKLYDKLLNNIWAGLISLSKDEYLLVFPSKTNIHLEGIVLSKDHFLTTKPVTLPPIRVPYGNPKYIEFKRFKKVTTTINTKITEVTKNSETTKTTETGETTETEFFTVPGQENNV